MNNSECYAYCIFRDPGAHGLELVAAEVPCLIHTRAYTRPRQPGI